MRAVAAQGRTVDSLRVAVLAALNIADELSRAEQAGGARCRQAYARAASLRGLLDEVLEEERQDGLVDLHLSGIRYFKLAVRYRFTGRTTMLPIYHLLAFVWFYFSIIVI